VDADLRSEWPPESELGQLYTLIRSRFLASQMIPARWRHVDLQIGVGKAVGQRLPHLTAHWAGDMLLFEGFLKVEPSAEAESRQEVPQVQVGQLLQRLDWVVQARRTATPPRYTEATLVAALEQYGIGRPSTYAGIVQNIQNKGYVEAVDRALQPTTKGSQLCDYLVRYFGLLFQVGYTAELEAQMDQIAAGQTDRLTVLGSFWRDHLAPALVPLTTPSAPPTGTTPHLVPAFTKFVPVG
jgi:DNA topoisomerase-1